MEIRTIFDCPHWCDLTTLTEYEYKAYQNAYLPYSNIIHGSILGYLIKAKYENLELRSTPYNIKRICFKEDN